MDLVDDVADALAVQLWVVPATAVMRVAYVVLGLLHQSVEPDAEVRGDHVHEAEPGDGSVPRDGHPGVHEDEVHLDEGEDHPGGGADDIQNVCALRGSLEVEVLAHLKPAVDHRTDAE